MADSNLMNIKLKIWRQAGPKDQGHFDELEAKGVSPDQSFLEMLDSVNEDLMGAGKDPVNFDHDCREGICGTCSLVINGLAHGPQQGTTTCQLHMRSFKDGDSITIEPWKATSFPVIKDLIVDRSAFDRIISAGGFISVNTGNAEDANSTLIPKLDADAAMDAATCIGCGACVASCKNASAMLFVAAKVSHLGLLPQGRVEAKQRVLSMVDQMDEEGFGNCTNQYECEAACPKEISVDNIARLNREFTTASFSHKKV
jgi:succinate dehydrogenase / fumarate reductase, iron-sulfur subunit